ncbi:hypothetical protein ACN5LI_001832 [Cronobacter turicensis]
MTRQALNDVKLKFELCYKNNQLQNGNPPTTITKALKTKVQKCPLEQNQTLKFINGGDEPYEGDGGQRIARRLKSGYGPLSNFFTPAK